MKLILSSAFLLVALLLSISAQQEPSEAVRREARNELNEAAGAYRDGNFAEARLHAEKALAVDPQNETAPLFIARIIHRQYKRGDQSPENIAKAHEAIEAYKRILGRHPQNDEAYKAIADILGAIKEHQLQRQWIQQRADDSSFSPEQRAEAYIVLASKDWHCSNEITDLPMNKETIVTKKKAIVRYRRPKDESEFQTAKQCAESGLRMIEMAIVLSPENESAWSYKTNLLLERSKVAEMENNLEEKAEFIRQSAEAQRRTDEISRKNKEQNP